MKFREENPHSTTKEVVEWGTRLRVEMKFREENPHSGFAPEDVRVLSEVRGVSLLENGRPDKAMASDHLPVMVELDF